MVISDEGNNDNYQLGTVAFMKVMIRTCQHVGALIKPVVNNIISVKKYTAKVNELLINKMIYILKSHF